MRYKFSSDKVSASIEALEYVKQIYTELHGTYRSEVNREQFSIAGEPDHTVISLLRYILGRYDGAIDPSDIHFSSDEEHFVDIEIQTSTRCIADALTVAMVRALLNLHHPHTEDPSIVVWSDSEDWIRVGHDTWGVHGADGIIRNTMSYSEV